MAGEKNINSEQDMESLIAAHLRGELNQTDHDQLIRWIAEKEEHRSFYEKTVKAWELSSSAEGTFRVDTNAAWQKVKAKTVNAGNSGTASQTGFLTQLWANPLYRAAAAILILALSTWSLSTLLKPVPTIAIMTTNEMKEVVMPDSTHIWLNKNTRLKYKVDYNKNSRQVELEGEAFFDVTHNPEKPFVVNGFRTVIEVKGTSFLVHSRPEEREEFVEVRTGRVLFRPKMSASSGEGAVLTAGDKGLLDAYMHVTTSKMENKTPVYNWKEQKLIFNNTSLKDVASQMNEYFGVDVKLAEGLDTCRFTGEFDKPTAEHVLEVISVSADLQWKKEQNKYILSGKKK